MYAELSTLLQRVDAHRMRELLLDFANIASPPGDTAIAAEWYAGCLRACGAVEAQVVREWPRTPSVVAGFPGIRRSPTLEVNGHLDTLPAPPARARYESGRVYGPGVAWNKGGLIAAAEAARVLAGQGPLPGGGLLLVAHSRSEPPDGDARDLARLIERGMVGDAVLITTGDHALAPVASLGLGIFSATFSLHGTAQHERYMAPGPDNRMPRTTIDAARAFCVALRRKRNALAWQPDAMTGAESLFVGCIAGGEHADREPRSCRVDGTWRWQPERSAWEVEAELESLAAQVAARCDVRAAVTLVPWREGYRLSPGEQVVRSLREAYRTVTGRDLPLGGSTLEGDAAIFMHQRRVAAISHGLDARTAQTADESVAVEELVRLTRVYICAALDYLSAGTTRREPGAEDRTHPAVGAAVPEGTTQRAALQGGWRH